MKPYYYVYRHGNQAPIVRHPTLDDASEESRRLAKLHPGVSFEILACLGITSIPKREPNTFWVDGVDFAPEEDVYAYVGESTSGGAFYIKKVKTEECL
jgi:hypothetical protein